MKITEKEKALAQKITVKENEGIDKGVVLNKLKTLKDENSGMPLPHRYQFFKPLKVFHLVKFLDDLERLGVALSLFSSVWGIVSVLVLCADVLSKYFHSQISIDVIQLKNLLESVKDSEGNKYVSPSDIMCLSNNLR